MDNNAVLVRITHNCDPRYIGLNEFKEEIKKDYPVQDRPKWIPSYSEGNEFWLDVFINSPAFEFVKNIVIGGLAWDLIKLGAKKINLKPLLQSIEKLLDQNIGTISFENVLLEFDDITIKIIGVNECFISNLSRIFDALYKEIPYLQSKGLKNISRIVIPVTKSEENNEVRYSYGLDDLSTNEQDFLTNWEIFAGFGCQRFIYNLKDRSIIEYYGRIY